MRNGVAVMFTRARRGNALIEFAIAASLLTSVFAGVWQFGYTFYLYNTLESAVRNGARYGSLATYDGGAWLGSAFRTRVKNMTVYGNPNPTGAPKPVVPGLTTDKITVNVAFNGVAPSRITVQVDNFRINALFAAFTLNAKPQCAFEYMGRYTVP